MSASTSAKRQRISNAAATSSTRPLPTPLSTEQRHSLHHAQCLENAASALDQLRRLRSGSDHLGQIAWSPHNVLATASNTRDAPSISASGHILVQYPVASSYRHIFKTSHLYPGPPSSTDASHAGSSQLQGQDNNAQPSPTRYDDPRHISFSPCGYYLCAYFPLRPGPPAQSHPSAEADVPDANGLPQNKDSNGAQLLPPPSAAASSSDATSSLPQPSASASTPEKPADRLRAKFCIWSRAETGALNDWRLVQSISVKPTSSRTGSAASVKPDNVLKVNEKGQQVARDGTRASPSDSISGTDADVLRGGVKQIVWLNRRRRIVLRSGSSSSNRYGASAFDRLAARGPSFLAAPSTTAEEPTPDEDVALVVFGHHGQVTLLSSRKTDREASSSAENGSPAAKHPNFFGTVLRSSLYTPSLQPSPITLDSTHNLSEPHAEKAGAYSSPFSTNRSGGNDPTSEDELDGREVLTHLTVGMPANDSVLLVASKRSSSSSSLIDLTEITVDLRGESINMTTRPLQPVSLSSADFAHLGDSPQNGSDGDSRASGLVDLDNISVLTWAEVDATGSDEDKESGRSGSLRLIACSSHLQASGNSAEPSDNSDATTAMHSTIACWDLHKTQNDLSDAFASLECRKTGRAPKWLDWQLRFAQSKVLPGQLVTSLIANTDGVAVANLAILTALTPAAGKEGLLSEQLSYFDLSRMDLAAAEPVTMPARTLSRSSLPVVSSNGTLIASLSSSHSGSSDKGIVMWKLPPYPRETEPAQAGADETRLRMAQLLALSSLRKSDTSDIGRAFASSASNDPKGSLLIDIGDLLKITESKRQDVLVKIEGATQKGPSHDSNSIPFHHALRLLKIRMAMGTPARVERRVLELGLCFQVLRLARVKTQVTVTPTPPVESGKKKGAAASKANTAAAETKERVYYRLESVWPLLAQLQWILRLLDAVSKLAVRSSEITSDAQGSELEFVRMLNKPTSRRLVLQILAHFCDFQEWLLSTTSKDNLPPGATADETDASQKVLAVSEQMALARETLNRVVGNSAVDLVEFTHLLAKVEGESNGGATGGGGSAWDADRFWWATLDGGKLDLGENVKAEHDSAGVQAKLLSAIVDPKSGALTDVLTLFLSPDDVSDERTVLYEKATYDDPAATSIAGTIDDKRLDIVRKVSLHNAISQASILNDASTLLRTHPTTQIAGSDSLVKINVMRAKRCVRCSALSHDPVTVTYDDPRPTAQGNPAFAVDPNLPPQVQMQMQMQMQMMQMMQQQQQQQQQKVGVVPFGPTGMVQPQPKLVRVEMGKVKPGDFRFSCVCGGGWWVL